MNKGTENHFKETAVNELALRVIMSNGNFDDNKANVRSDDGDGSPEDNNENDNDDSENHEVDNVYANKDKRIH